MTALLAQSAAAETVTQAQRQTPEAYDPWAPLHDDSPAPAWPSYGAVASAAAQDEPPEAAGLPAPRNEPEGKKPTKEEADSLARLLVKGVVRVQRVVGISLLK